MSVLLVTAVSTGHAAVASRTVFGEVTAANPAALLGAQLTITVEFDEDLISPVGQTIVNAAGGGGGFVAGLISFEASAGPLFFDSLDDNDFPFQPKLTFVDGELTSITTSLMDVQGNVLEVINGSFTFDTSVGSGSEVIDYTPVIPEPAMLLVFGVLLSSIGCVRCR